MNRPRQTATPTARLILYVRNFPRVTAFYQRHFGFQPLPGIEEKDWLELASANGGNHIALHQASVAQKRGSEIKIAYAVQDVLAF